MSRFAHSFTRFARLAMVLAAAYVMAPTVASAAAGDTPQPLWMAASGTEPTIGSSWGRLTLKDGVLRFRSTGVEWELAVSDIKRASISPQSDQFIVVEGVNGETYYVAILGPNMMVDSPRKALQVIQKSLGPATGARRER
jgi:hypothetical protein